MKKIEDNNLIGNDESKSGTAYNVIKKKIVQGELKPNTIIIDTNWSKILNISRTPIRHALVKLENEGFVEFIPNKGWFVADIYLSDVVEIYNIRMILDPFIIGICLENNNPETYKKLKKNLEEQEKAIKKGDYKEYLIHDLEFHKIYLSDSNYKILQVFLGSINDKVERLANTTIGDEERAKRSVEQHRQILEAYSQKNLNDVKILIEKHMVDIKQYYINKLTKSSNYENMISR